ncbi:MAG TPA: hypothetical protein VGK78_11125 [Nocardioides sp.]|uniref:hypothetical protein n=1 Tax=Nocardioides sp. TaxID=35761 RepID=UPI002F40F869
MSRPTTPPESPPTASSDGSTGASGGARSGRVGPILTWFAVVGGVVAWAVSLAVSWSTMELGCLVRYPAYDLQHGGSPSRAEYAVTIGAIVIPWLVTLLALLACLRLRVLVRRLEDDDLAKGRLHLLMVIGLFLDSMMLAAITGGGIALYVLEAC